jgi:hypothetical protein
MDRAWEALSEDGELSTVVSESQTRLALALDGPSTTDTWPPSAPSSLLLSSGLCRAIPVLWTILQLLPGPGLRHAGAPWQYPERGL